VAYGKHHPKATFGRKSILGKWNIHFGALGFSNPGKKRAKHFYNLVGKVLPKEKFYPQKGKGGKCLLGGPPFFFPQGGRENFSLGEPPWGGKNPRGRFPSKRLLFFWGGGLYHVFFKHPFPKKGVFLTTRGGGWKPPPWGGPKKNIFPPSL